MTSGKNSYVLAWFPDTLAQPRILSSNR
jgi:hypothetical protein